MLIQFLLLLTKQLGNGIGNIQSIHLLLILGVEYPVQHLIHLDFQH